MHMIDRTARVKGLHLRHRTSLPPLDGKGPGIPHMHLLQRGHIASDWSTDPPLGQLRGRTSERGLEQPPVPRDPKMPQPPTSRGLMTRRTFNLPRAESPVPIPEGPPTRAPRAPGDVRPLASTMMRQVPHRPPRPLAATFQEGESTELPRRRHRSTSVTPPGEASASASRAGSEGEGGELCPTRSILRSSNSRERSHQKRVSFSNDCKRAPPASMADLIRTCPDDLDKRETSPSSPSLGGTPPKLVLQ